LNKSNEICNSDALDEDFHLSHHQYLSSINDENHHPQFSQLANRAQQYNCVMSLANDSLKSFSSSHIQQKLEENKNYSTHHDDSRSFLHEDSNRFDTSICSKAPLLSHSNHKIDSTNTVSNFNIEKCIPTESPGSQNEQFATCQKNLESQYRTSQVKTCDMNALAARLNARNQFLNARTCKVMELRTAIEKSTKRHKQITSQKRRLKAIVKMIMCQIKMSKTLLANEAGSTMMDAEIDIFAEFDESALLDQLNDELSISLTDVESQEEVYMPIEPPNWANVESKTRAYEIQLAAYDAKIMELATESAVPTPEIEDWIHATSRTKVFAMWYVSKYEHRSIWFKHELAAVSQDAQVCECANQAGVTPPPWDEGDIRLRHDFEQWYCRSSKCRTHFLFNLVQRLGMSRSTMAIRRDLSNFYFHGDCLRWSSQLIRVVPLGALIACQPPPPKRYLLYPSKTPETWSAAEILQWSNAVTDTDTDKITQALISHYSKWHNDNWLREEGKRQIEAQLAFAWEDERAARLRTVEVDIMTSDRSAFARATDADADNAEWIFNALKDGDNSNERPIYALHLYSAFLENDTLRQYYVLGSGLRCFNEDDSHVYQERILAAEELSLEYEKKLRKRDEERKCRKDDERKQKEEDENSRRIEKSAKERERLLEELALVRKCKSERSKSQLYEKEIARQNMAEKLDADKATVLFVVKQARDRLIDKKNENLFNSESLSLLTSKKEGENFEDVTKAEKIKIEEFKQIKSPQEKKFWESFYLRFTDEESFNRAYVQSIECAFKECALRKVDLSSDNLNLLESRQNVRHLPASQMAITLFSKISNSYYAQLLPSNKNLVETIRFSRVADTNNSDPIKLKLDCDNLNQIPLP